jgi:hypothetical protein
MSEEKNHEDWDSLFMYPLFMKEGNKGWRSKR